MMPRLADEQLLESVRDLADDIGSAPTTTDMRAHGPHDTATYFDRWDSWGDVLAAAGLSPDENPHTVSDSELVAELASVASELHHAPRTSDIKDLAEYHVDTYRARFGGLEQALQRAEVPTHNLGYQCPEEDLVREIRNVAARVGYRPKSSEMEDYGKYTLTTYLNRWESWNGALAAAGFDPLPEDSEIRRQELLDELRRLYDLFDERPAQWHMKYYGEFSREAYLKQFDDWNTALDEAGLPTRTYEIPTEDLTAELERLADELGQRPTTADIEERAEYALWTYYDRFGDKESMLVAAGVE